MAFPPASLTWIGFVALVPLFWAVLAPPAPGEAPLGFRRQFLIGFAGQFVFFCATLHWILFLPNEEITIPGLMIPALVFLSAYMALFFGLAAALGGLAERQGRAPAWVALPVFWTLGDCWRSLGTLAFPWGSLGYSLARHPAALQMSAWTGFWSLTFWILLVNGLFSAAARAWAERGRGRALAPLVGGLLVLAAPLVFGKAVLAQAPPLIQDAPDGVRLALLQPNTSREIKWKKGFERVVVEDLLGRTARAAQTEPDLIVWPETAAPLMILWDPQLAERTRAVIGNLQRWVLVGTLDAVLLSGDEAEEYNAAILYNPEGLPVQRYYKTHLVPFSEVMPFQKQIPWINALNFGQSNFSSGREKNLFVTPKVRFSVLICFESIFPRQAREAVRAGAQLLLNTTNDFWFGKSAGPAQHAEMAIHRAVENRTPLARCANTGVSYFVDPYGRTFMESGLFVESTLITRVKPGRGGSFYTRHGEWFAAALLLLGGLILAESMRRVRWRWPGGMGRPQRARGPAAQGEQSHG